MSTPDGLSSSLSLNRFRNDWKRKSYKMKENIVESLTAVIFSVCLKYQSLKCQFQFYIMCIVYVKIIDLIYKYI